MRRKYDRWDVPKVFPHLLVFNFFKLIQHETCRFWFVNADVIFHENLLTCFEGCSWKISGVSWNLQRAISADGSEIRLTSPVEVGHFFSLFTKVFAPSKRWLFGIFSSRVTTRWWFQIFFIFTPTWGRFPIWLIFCKGVGSTTNQIKRIIVVTTWLLVIRARKFDQAIQSKLQSACEGTSGSLAQLWRFFLLRKLGADRNILYAYWLQRRCTGCST